MAIGKLETFNFELETFDKEIDNKIKGKKDSEEEII
jgi:hypothetical protein